MWNFSKLIISNEFLSLIGEVDEFKGAWQLFGRLAPERLTALRRVATIESIGSSTRIEGSKLSDKEVEELLSRISTYSFISRDEQEVAGYAYVCEEIFQGFEVIPFTENVIKQFHGWLLQYSDKDQRHRGEYKKFTNHVEAFDSVGKSLGVVFETASPFDTPIQMQELISWTRNQLDSKEMHPLLVIGLFAVIFLAIHPFQDGNGRLSRLLTTLLLLKAGYSYVPYSSLESVIERNKESYYLSLRRTQGSLKESIPDFQPWLAFFLKTLQKQKIHLEQKVSREKAMHLHISERSRTILFLLQEHGKLGITPLENLSKQNRNTLKKTLSELTATQQILKHGKGKATWYTLE